MYDFFGWSTPSADTKLLFQNGAHSHCLHAVITSYQCLQFLRPYRTSGSSCHRIGEWLRFLRSEGSSWPTLLPIYLQFLRSDGISWSSCRQCLHFLRSYAASWSSCFQVPAIWRNFLVVPWWREARSVEDTNPFSHQTCIGCFCVHVSLRFNRFLKASNLIEEKFKDQNWSPVASFLSVWRGRGICMWVCLCVFPPVSVSVGYVSVSVCVVSYSFVA